MTFENDEDIEVLSLIEGIVDVMEEDGFNTVTKDQIVLMGKIANKKIANSIRSTETLLKIFDELKFISPFELDEIKTVGGLIIRVQKDMEIEDKLEAKKDG